MGKINGVGAAINGVGCAQQWEIRSTVDLESIVCTASDGAGIVTVGNSDWTGTYAAFGHTPAVKPGDSFSFEGALSNGSAAYGTSMVKRVQIFWPVEAGQSIYHQVLFEGNGALAFKTNSTVADSSTPLPVTAKGCGLTIGATSLPVRQMILDIWKTNEFYNDTDTAGVTARLAGNLFAKFQADCYFDDWTDLPTQGSFSALQFGVGGGAYWALTYGVFGPIVSAVQVHSGDNRSRLVMARVGGDWSSVKTSDGTTGAITTPGGTSYWPTA